MKHEFKTVIGKAIYETLITDSFYYEHKKPWWIIRQNASPTCYYIEHSQTENRIYLSGLWSGRNQIVTYRGAIFVDYFKEGYLSYADVQYLVKVANEQVLKSKRQRIEQLNIRSKEQILDSAGEALAKAYLSGDKEALRPLVDCCLEQL